MSTALPGADGYMWYGLTGDTILTPTIELMTTLPVSTRQGVYNLCVKAVSYCDTSESVCIEIEVEDIVDCNSCNIPIYAASRTGGRHALRARFKIYCQSRNCTIICRLSKSGRSKVETVLFVNGPCTSYNSPLIQNKGLSMFRLFQML